ncbi:MAG TPA: hypothetical protein VFU25_04120 [Ornithinibacter sp.]|nr:hypothetical protein [Ornithinibacter sp.]
MAKIARALGRPLIPWQRAIADVAGEIDPATGRLAYQRVVMIVPRRAGKSLLLLAEGLDAGRTHRHRKAFYSSHRRETAAAMWRDDWIPWVEESPLGRYLSIRRANGSENFRWRGVGSTLRLLPPDGDAMRSFAANLAMVDEAREFDAGQGEAVEAGMFPTMATGSGGQIWIASSAGDAASEWLTRWRDIGRAAAAADTGTGTAYLEFAAPDGADLDDEATWFAAHPGLGHHVLLDALRADHQVMRPDTFACEYLGVWPETRVDRALVDGWANTLDPAAALAGWPAFAVETTVDRDRSVIVAAGHTPDGRVTVELVEDRPHGPWLAARLGELVDAHHPLALAWDAGGPVAALRRDLDELPAPPAPLNTRDVAAACGALHDRILAGALVHRDDDRLAAAVAAARQVRAGGSWLWDRREPDAGPLLAAALAVWALLDRTRTPPVIT